MVTKDTKQELLRIARLSIEAKLDNRNYVPDYTQLTDDCFEKRGLYIVLVQDGYLKSMAGITESNKELYQSAQEFAINAAFHSHSYKKVVKSDLPNLVIEISLLSDPKKLEYNGPEELQSRIHSKMGIMLKEGMHKQVFLPTMWRMYPDKEDFLNRLCSDAGLQEASWRRVPLNLYYFTADTFAEDDDKK